MPLYISLPPLIDFTSPLDLSLDLFTECIEVLLDAGDGCETFGIDEALTLLDDDLALDAVLDDDGAEVSGFFDGSGGLDLRARGFTSKSADVEDSLARLARSIILTRFFFP